MSLWYAAVKDYLHLRIVGAYHLPVLPLFFCITCTLFYFCHASKERSPFHPQVITRTGNSFKILNKFGIARVKLDSEKCMYSSTKKMRRKCAIFVWSFGLISKADCWHMVSFYLRKALWYFEIFIWRHFPWLEGTFFRPPFFYIVSLSATDGGLHFQQ